MAFCKISNKVNVDILVDLCGGNRFEALEKCRFYSGIKINVSVKTLERELCDDFIRLGYEDKQIVEMLSIREERVKIRRTRVENEK